MRKSFRQKEKKMPHFFRTDKKLRVIHSAIILLLLFMMFAIPQSASACSCVMPGSPAMEFSQLDAVFSGKVMNIRENYTPIISFVDKIMTSLGLDPIYFYTDKLWGNTVTFTVTHSWKLVDTTTVQLRTGNGGGDCGYPFSTGSDYLVYAGHAPGEGYGTSICTRTTELSMAAEDMAFLKTLRTIPLTQPPPTWGQILVIAIPGIFIFSAILIFFVWRRKPHPTG
jgi:hypothetical protein